MENRYHILIIDDDDRIRELLKQYLMKNNFLVSAAPNTKVARELIATYIFDLFVIDLMMPEENGAEFLKSIRCANNKIPAIILTALGDINNKIDCFEGGANDYMVKPFEPKELLLRINNLINKNSEKFSSISFGNFAFDPDKNILKNNGEQIYLTDIEMKLISVFTKNLNKVLSREKLLEDFPDMNERSIDVSIARLRKKIELNPKQPKFLRTIRNQGYVLNN